MTCDVYMDAAIFNNRALNDGKDTKYAQQRTLQPEPQFLTH